MKILKILLLFLLPHILFAANLDKVRFTPTPGTVTLTFDDGPSPIYTPQVLAILKKYNIKATFFVVGASAKKYPELIKEILAQGHALASHSYTHPMLTKMSDQKLHFEVVNTSDVIEKITGKRPVCLRPPFGDTNSHVRTYIRAHGMIPVRMGWNSFDYERPGVTKIINQVVNNAHNGQVFLLHDGYAQREQTVAALPAIIEGIQKKKLGFSAICYN